MNALIVNCSGLGDGIIEIPFLKTLEVAAPHVRYFHTAGRLFRDRPFVRALGLQSYAGPVPARWRKFHEEDWQHIRAFMAANRIALVINLRHIGPEYDVEYFSFKARHGVGTTFLNYDFDKVPATPVNIRDTMKALLRSESLVNDSHDQEWLRRLVPRQEGPISGHIGININTGSTFKQWPLHKWRALCGSLAKRGCRLTVLSGHTAEERGLSTRIVADIEHGYPGRARLVASTDVIDTLTHLSELECLITADSWPVHAATGIGVRTIGLYIVTSPIMWGGDPCYSCPAESRHLQRCQNFERRLGICRNHYVTCPLIETEGDGIEVSDVLALVRTCATGVGHVQNPPSDAV
jgi:ADP-heptose:LPS heptosyltransferase